MDPLGVVQELSHSIRDIRRWGFVRSPSIHEIEQTNEKIQTPFPFDPDLNHQVALWAGDVTRLRDVDAIIHPTNEATASRDPISLRIMEVGGPELAKEIRIKVKGSKTGEARLTEAFSLPARFVIHVIGPRFHERYVTAAETALYQAYRSLLDIVRSESLSSVALTCVHSQRRGYPVVDGAHLALRTVRHFLQRTLKPKSPENVEALASHPWGLQGADPLFVFCVTDDELEAYKSAMPLYFPRSVGEERWASTHLPSDIGGTFGEPLRPWQELNVQARLAPNPSSDDNRLLEEIAAEESAVGRSDFAQMEDDHDKKALIRYRETPTSPRVSVDGAVPDFRAIQYARLVERAKKEDFSRFSSLRCLYRSGVDRVGRTVVVFVGRQLPFDAIDEDKALLYLVHVLDPVADKPFSIVYLHTLCSGETTPPTSFLKRVFAELPPKFDVNLVSFYLVHPTVFSRVFMWFFTSFKASTMKSRYNVIKSLHQLYSFISPDQLDIPPFVLHHDTRVNRGNYSDANSANQLPRLTESVATGWTVGEL